MKVNSWHGDTLQEKVLHLVLEAAKLFEILFSVQFLLKILIIVAIIVLINGELKVDVNVYHRGSIDVGSESGGFKIKKIE